MSRFGKILLSIILVPSLVAAAAWVIYHETRVPQDERQALNRMIELQKEGRYDKAAQVMEIWMRDSRRDTSHDELLYGQIAFVWIAKAYTRRSKDESIRRAEENLQRALNLYDGQSHNELSLEPFEIGGSYELLADIADRDKCRLYATALELLERQLPLIKGESYTAYGHTTPLEPVRRDVRKHLDAINEKSSKAGCQAHSEQR
jgi:tetratricopeptide (TPR) repeat protein